MGIVENVVTFRCEDCGEELIICGELDEIAFEIAEFRGWNVEIAPELCKKCYKSARDRNDHRLY